MIDKPIHDLDCQFDGDLDWQVSVRNSNLNVYFLYDVDGQLECKMFENSNIGFAFEGFWTSKMKLE